MADYWISFRIKYDTAEGYDRRYAALEKAIDECTEYAEKEKMRSMILR